MIQNTAEVDDSTSHTFFIQFTYVGAKPLDASRPQTTGVSFCWPPSYSNLIQGEEMAEIQLKLLTFEAKGSTAFGNGGSTSDLGCTTLQGQLFPIFLVILKVLYQSQSEKSLSSCFFLLSESHVYQNERLICLFSGKKPWTTFCTPRSGILTKRWQNMGWVRHWRTSIKQGLGYTQSHLWKLSSRTYQINLMDWLIFQIRYMNQWYIV